MISTKRKRMGDAVVASDDIEPDRYAELFSSQPVAERSGSTSPIRNSDDDEELPDLPTKSNALEPASSKHNNGHTAHDRGKAAGHKGDKPDNALEIPSSPDVSQQSSSTAPTSSSLAAKVQSPLTPRPIHPLLRRFLPSPGKAATKTTDDTGRVTSAATSLPREQNKGEGKALGTSDWLFSSQESARGSSQRLTEPSSSTLSADLTSSKVWDSRSAELTVTTKKKTERYIDIDIDSPALRTSKPPSSSEKLRPQTVKLVSTTYEQQSRAPHTSVSASRDAVRPNHVEQAATPMPSSSNASLRSKMRNLARETLPERSKSTVVTPISSSTRSSPRTTKTKSNLKPTPPDRAPPPRERFREAAGMSGQPKRPKTSASTQQSVIIRDNKGWCISGQDHTDEDDSDTVTVKKSVNMTPRHNYSPIRPASSSMDGGRRRSGVANSSRGKHGQPLSTLDRVNGRSQGRSGSPAARAGLRTSPSESPGPSLETQRFYDEFANQLIGGNGMNSTASDDELFSEDDVRDGEDLVVRHGSVNPNAIRLPDLLAPSVCRQHREERDIIPQGLQEGYPEPNGIDWKAVPRRMEKYHRSLLSVVSGEQHSSFREEAIQEWQDKGARRMGNVLSEWTSFEQELPGYYGPRGFEIIMKWLNDAFVATSLLLADDVKPLDVQGYLRRVLVPEVAILLIQEDNSQPGVPCSRVRAVRILKKSRAYGSAVFPSSGEDAEAENEEEEELEIEVATRRIAKARNTGAEAGRRAYNAYMEVFTLFSGT
ncbi:hypothetical protein EMMF5_005970 [Cystobasidiomycetes sp. EMM_F5]